MATTGATGSTRVDTPRTNGSAAGSRERNHETKAAIKTTEFWAMLGLVVTILVSAALINGGDNGTDEFIAKQAWLYVSILGGATSSPAASRSRAATSPTPTTTRLISPSVSATATTIARPT